jgi:hypothetical protein
LTPLVPDFFEPLLLEILQGCWKKNPSERFSATELNEKLLLLEEREEHLRIPRTQSRSKVYLKKQLSRKLELERKKTRRITANLLQRNSVMLSQAINSNSINNTNNNNNNNNNPCSDNEDNINPDDETINITDVDSLTTATTTTVKCEIEKNNISKNSNNSNNKTSEIVVKHDKNDKKEKNDKNEKNNLVSDRKIIDKYGVISPISSPVSSPISSPFSTVSSCEDIPLSVIPNENTNELNPYVFKTSKFKTIASSHQIFSKVSKFLYILC